ncbi:MAG TPA: hypothetical protein PLM79_11290 [Syntrophobacteraceae bacterium]|nr:hypothetical protein [Syntrophobacteraceae bacterium]
MVDFDVSPRGLETAGILKDKNGRFRLFLWNLEEEAVGRWMEVPGSMELRSLACHPRGRNVFVSGGEGKAWGIWRVDLAREKPSFHPVLKSPREIRRIVPGPRPFITRYDPKTGTPVPAYRIFYGSKNPAGTYSVRSITEARRTKERQRVFPGRVFHRGNPGRKNRVEKEGGRDGVHGSGEARRPQRP